MADKKTAKKAEEVKTIAQLRQELATKQTDLLEARRGHAAGELANPRVLTTTKKEIARLHTAIRALELSEKESK
ncbi:50S ribosomal protein L29 [Streptomyces caniscabiei]|uniref:50S ribosomal protein L29 n=1 Tax=Streptomyces caniscabiei TaxID=2746961 RepID=UPI0029B0D1D9|nr:50S ribosomal protein L29 [Streptomyces caniscabiei]MDX2775930.1 50S ribosomal protein L29 [Streptomyces caniscabiei]